MLIIPFTFSIDASTYAFAYAKNRIVGDSRNECSYLFVLDDRAWIFGSKKFRADLNRGIPKISVVIPAYNEEDSIESTVRSLYDQTLRPKNVIVVDDCSTDGTPEICQRLKKELGDTFIYIRRERNSGKASNISFVTKEFVEQLGEITLINDSDTTPYRTCIERLVKNFAPDDVAAATPYGYTTAPRNWIARTLHYGNAWNNRIFKFRKKAQYFRGGISVVCGACTAYRTKVLLQLPIPQRTKTEDTDYTWILQENGYKVVYDETAQAYSRDLAKPTALLRQWFRWYSGTYQSIFVHGRQLLRAKSLFWATVLPAIVESVPYSLGVFTLPIIIVINLAMPAAHIPYFGMAYVKGFLLADFLFTAIPTAIISPGYLLRLPHIYFYKYAASSLTLLALLKTIYEGVTGQKHKWGSTWSRRYGLNAQQN
jgi:cellulose synthase/poly-beta-1,6-N-acetylglucosamine synthase-like glycosyltransferase